MGAGTVTRGSVVGMSSAGRRADTAMRRELPLQNGSDNMSRSHKDGHTPQWYTLGIVTGLQRKPQPSESFLGRVKPSNVGRIPKKLIRAGSTPAHRSKGEIYGN